MKVRLGQWSLAFGNDIPRGVVGIGDHQRVSSVEGSLSRVGSIRGKVAKRTGAGYHHDLWEERGTGIDVGGVHIGTPCHCSFIQCGAHSLYIF